MNLQDDIHEIIKLIPLSDICIKKNPSNLEICEEYICLSDIGDVGDIALEVIKTKELVMNHQENKTKFKRRFFKNYPLKEQNYILRFLADYESY